MNQAAAFPTVDQLLLTLENNQLVLPTLPDIAIKIQQMIDDINVSANQIVSVISGDPMIAAQLIKTANSAIYADKPKVDNVRTAISRLGYKSLRNLVLNITMTRLSKADHPVIKKQLADFWEHSREVATFCYVLAKNLKHLNPDQAMLAGLIHDIGTLPLCLHAEKSVPDLDSETLGMIIRKFRAQIGEKLLRAWNFPPELLEVIAGHDDLQRETDSPLASYTDIVTVANLLNRATSKVTAWENVTALKRLCLCPEVCQTFHERFADEIRISHEMLFPH